MNQYYEKQGKIYFKFKYNPNIISSIKKIEGRWYHPEIKEWSIPISRDSDFQLKELIENFNFETLKSENNINTYLTKDISLETLKTYRNLILNLNLNFKLREYQYHGVDLMNHFYDCINGDDMGLGKTLQSIYAVESMNNFPCLVICPSSVKYHWAKYWSETNKNRTISVIDTSNKINNFNADVVIINYSYIHSSKIEEDVNGNEKKRIYLKFNNLDREWGCLICDEVHLIKNGKANRTKIVHKLAKRAKRKIGLTGTLIENRPIELISPLMMIGKFNSIFRNWKFFTDRYCDPKEKRFGHKKFVDITGASNLIELNSILRSSCYIRREKKEVYEELPDRQENIESIEITNRKEYLKAEDNFVDFVMDTFTEEEQERKFMAEYLVQRNQLRQLSIKGKLNGIVEWLENYSEATKEKLIVFGVHREPLTKLAVNFNCDIIDGSINAFQKQEVINNFKTSNNQFLFGNIEAMGTGTDGLQHSCSNMVIIELPDTPSKLDQAISRIERIGSKVEGTNTKINIYYLLCEDTIDFVMWQSIETKRIITEAINKGIEVNMRSFDSILIEKIKEKRNIC